MSIAKVQSLSTFISAANTGVILVSITHPALPSMNGETYFLEVPVAGLATMRARIEAKGSLVLKHWTRATCAEDFTVNVPERQPEDEVQPEAKASPITSHGEVSPAQRIHLAFKAKIDALAAAGDKAAIEAMAKRQYGRSKGAIRKLETCSGDDALMLFRARAYLAQLEYEYAFAALKTIKAAA